MLKLEESKHSYYCECWEGAGVICYESWKDFVEDGEYDMDCNLLFRFDIKPEYDENGEETGDFLLELHHALQRHGTSQWHVVIHNIQEKDLEEIEEFLRKAKEHLFSMWKEIGE